MSLNNNVRNLFVGFKCKTVENWKELVPVPVPPKNYVRTEVIDNWIEKAWIELSNLAATLPLAGTVCEATVVDATCGKTLFTGEGVKLYNWLCECIPELKTNNGIMRIWAIDGRKLLHLCALEAAIKGCLGLSWGLYLNAFMSFPSEIGDVVEIWDPIHLLLGSDGDIPTKVDLLKKFMHKNNNVLTTEGVLGSNTEKQALFVQEVWKAFGFNRDII